MIIDVHNHIVPEQFPSSAGRAAGKKWPYMEHIEPGKANVMIEGKNFRTVQSGCWAVPRRVAELGNQAVDRQALSPMPQLCDYSLDLKDGSDLAMFLNETILRMIEAAPDRFYGLGSVPLQDVDAAAKMLSKVKSMGLHGVEIVSNIEGVSPGDPRFIPFFKEAASLGLAVFIHAQHPTYMDRLVGHPMLENSIGFPIESALAAASMITGGVIDHAPGLRVLFSHGGGNFLLLLPRLNNAYSGQGPLKGTVKRAPMEYAREFFYDDVLFDNRAVRFLIDMVGVSQVMIGSDYPFMTRKQTADQEFTELKLTAEERELVGSKNALRFLGIGD
ncbi:MAG: amidohydrolase [SAR202 cluster bacterium]|nr:amidohydrolase [SAR202 cluster bacterium]